MKKLALALLFVFLFVGIAYADRLGVLITEDDASPDGYAYQLVFGAGTVSLSNGVATIGSTIGVYTVATLPGTPIDGQLGVVTDGSTATDCTSGGGSTINLCVYDDGASTWTIVGDGTGGAGSGSVTTIEENDVQVGGADIVYLDFGYGFAITESPDTEININFDVTPSSGNATLVVEEDAIQVKYDTTDFSEGSSGLTLSASPTIATSLSFGADPADAGTIRMPNAGSIVWEDATEASITHVDNTGWLINSTHQLQFGDSATYINQANDGHLDINADTSIDLNGPIVVTDNTATMTHSGTTSFSIVSTSGTVIVEGTTFTGNDVSAAGDITAVGGDVTIAAAGVKLSGATGILTLAGVGGTYNENLTFDMEPATDTNTVDVGTGTGVTTVDFGSINLATDALDLSEGNITNAGDIALDSISADDTNISIVASSGTVTVESVVFTGANLSSVGTVGLTGGITISADEATLVHSGTTSFSVTSTSGTVIIEGTTFNGNNTTVAGDLTISGDDLVMATNTIGAVLVGDGTNFNPVVMGGNATIGADGAVALADDCVAAAEMADADHGMVSWTSGAATVEDFALNADADAGDYDITSIDKLEGYDTAIYIDMGTDGYIDLEADTGIRFNGPVIFANEGELRLPSSDASPDSTGELRHDSVVSGVTNGMLEYHDGTNVRYVVDLTTLPSDDDYVVAYDADNDIFYMKVDQSAGAPSFDTVADPEAAVTLSHDDAETITITTAQATAGSFFIIDNTVADVENNVYLIEGQYTDDDDANAFFLKFSDNNGAEVEFSVGPQGVVSIGEDPADAGTIRLPNAAVIAFEDATEATITHVDNTGFAFNLGIDIQSGGITLANDETITNATDGTISFNGKIEMDGTDPHIFYDETDGTDWYLGTDDTGNTFEFRTNATIGNSVVLEISETGTGITIGDDGDDDIAITFRANGDDGVFTWMEDEQYFKYSDAILMDGTGKIQFYDTAIYIQSANDGYLDLEADTGIRFNAPVTFANEGAITLPVGTAIGDVEFTDLDAGSAYSNFGAAGDNTLNELFAAIDTAWSALGGDVTAVGNCSGGDCLDGSSDGGTTISLYDGDSHKLTIDAADLTGDATIVLGGDTNNINIVNGTANIDIASGVTVDFDKGFQVTTNAGILAYTAASKTLSVEDNATVSQDYSSDATPTFAGIIVDSIDVNGAADLDIGSADVTDVTITTDGGVIVLDGGGTTIFEAVNDGNPSVSLGSSAAEALSITATYESGGQLLESVTFATVTEDTDADDGEMIFSVDGSTILTVNDGGLVLGASLSIEGTTALTIGAGTETVAINTSDWDIDATGAITGTSIDGDSNTITNIGNSGIKWADIDNLADEGLLVIADESSDTTCFPLFVTAATGNLAGKTGTNLTFNSSTGLLVATGIQGTTVSDGTATLTSGAWTGITSLSMSGTLTMGNGGTMYQSGDNYITFTENSDSMQLYFGGTDVDITWTDGVLNIRNNEDSVDAIVEIEGKDAGEKGVLRVLSDGDDKYITLYHNDTDSWVASSSGDIILAPDGDTDDYALLSTDTNVTSFSVTGGTGTLGTTTNEWNILYLGDSSTIQFGADQDVTLTHVADTALSLNLDFRIADNYGLVLGSNQDWDLYYDETTNDALTLSTAAIASTATTTGMFRIVVNSGNGTLTDDQEVLEIVNYTTELLSLDENGNLTIAGGIYTAASDDPGFVLNDDTTGDLDIWAAVITNDGGSTAGDYFKIGTGTTIGSGTDLMTLDASGNVVFTATVKGTSLVLEGGTYDITIDADSPTSSVTYSWPNAPPALDGYALTSTAAGVMSWSVITATAGSEGGGADGEVQYSVSGTLTGENAFYYTQATNTLTINQLSTNVALQTGDGTYGGFGHTPQVGFEGVLEVDGNVYADADLYVGDDVFLLSDDAVLNFGADSDVKITHDPDDGLFLKSTATADNNPFVLTLQTGETDMETGDVLGGIYFQAPDEGTDTDSRLVAAGIEAVSEGDFSATSNATKLSFKTGASETATEKMSLSSAGVLTVSSDAVLTGGDLTLISATAGAGITGGDGTISLKGLGSGTDEIMTIDLNSANLITIASSTDATFAFTPAVGFTAATTHSAGLVVADSQTLTFDESASNPDDADVVLSASDGVLTIAAANGDNNENMTLDFDAASNVVTINSGTSATFGITPAVSFAGALTASANEATFTHSGTTSFTLISTSGTVIVEGLTVNDTVITGASSITSTAFVGALTGNADTATTGTKVVITDNESTAEANAVAFVADADIDGSTSIGLESDGDFTYNPSTGTVTATAFAGNLTGAVTGNADTATTATNVVITDNESTAEANAIAFVADADVDGSTSIGLESDGDFTYNPSTGTVTAGNLVVTGQASGGAKTYSVASGVTNSAQLNDVTGNITLIAAEVQGTLINDDTSGNKVFELPTPAAGYNTIINAAYAGNDIQLTSGVSCYVDGSLTAGATGATISTTTVGEYFSAWTIWDAAATEFRWVIRKQDD